MKLKISSFALLGVVVCGMAQIDKEINQIVYEFYDLAKEEIKIVMETN